MNKCSVRAFILLIWLTVFTACTFEEPTLPSWFVDWTLPIPNPGFTMLEALNDSTIIDTTDSEVPIIAVSIKDSIDRQRLSDSDLGIKPENDRLSQSIGDIELTTPPTEISDPISAEGIILDLGGDSLIAGNMISLPQTSISPDPIYVSFQNFNFVDVKDGSMRIHFLNNTFLDIGAGLAISIFDSLSNIFLGTANYSQPIGSGENVMSSPIDLNDKQFSEVLRFELVVPLEELLNYPLTEQDISSSMHFEASFIRLIVSQAVAEIPEQDFSEEDSVSLLEENDRIIFAKIDAGEFALRIENEMPVGANIAIELLNFYSDPAYDSASVFSETYQLEANSEDTVTISLAGLYLVDYDQQPNPGSFIDYLQYNIDVTTIPTFEPVSITEDDSVIVSINVNDSIFVGEFSGEIDTRNVTFDPQEQKDIIPIDDFEGSIFLDDLSMILTISNQIGFKIELDLDITGYKNDQAESMDLIFNENPITVQKRESGENVHVTTVILNSANSNIVDFIEFLPQDIVTAGSATVGGQGEVGEVTLGDEVWAEYHIYSPLYLRIANEASYKSDVESADGIIDEVMTGSLQLELTNGLPIGAQLVVYVATDPQNLFNSVILDSSQKLILDDFDFSAGTDLDLDGFVDMAFIDTISIDLDEQDMEVLKNDQIFVGAEILVDDTEGLVKFRQTDQITAIGAFKARYKVNPDGGSSSP